MANLILLALRTVQKNLCLICSSLSMEKQIVDSMSLLYCLDRTRWILMMQLRLLNLVALSGMLYRIYRVCVCLESLVDEFPRVLRGHFNLCYYDFMFLLNQLDFLISLFIAVYNNQKA